MKHGYSKAQRLLSKTDFQSLRRGSLRVVGRCLCIDVRAAGRASSRLGISASRKFGVSHERSRFKRIVREAFRLSHRAWAPLDLHVVPRSQAKGASSIQIRDELLTLLISYGA